MIVGYVLAVVAMLSIGILGLLSKLADRYECSPLNTALVLFGSSTVVMAIYVRFVQGESLRPPTVVLSTGLFFGALAILAFWVFLYGLQFGKLTSSWIFMNLSAVVPAVLSAGVYHEPITLLKALALVLVVASILLLWLDRQKEAALQSASDSDASYMQRGRWITAMLAAFFLNGICPFGLRVLAGKGLGLRYTALYLVYWYLAGFGFGLLGLLRARVWPSRANVLVGMVMAVASVGGQFCMGAAISRGVPGSVVYMLGMGASMCVVVLGGVLFFRERVGVLAWSGIVVGLSAAIFLSFG